MNKQTSNILKKLGVPPHFLGYEYLGEAVEIVLADRRKLHAMTTFVYPSVAEKFNSTPTRVERAIRHSIGVAFCSLTPTQIEELFGNTLRNANPTNSHFIAAIVEMMEFDMEVVK